MTEKVGTIWRFDCGCLIAESSHGELFYPHGEQGGPPLVWPCAAHTTASLMKTQRDYDQLVAFFGVAGIDRSTQAAMDLHERIMRIMRGQEPNPLEPQEPAA